MVGSESLEVEIESPRQLPLDGYDDQVTLIRRKTSGPDDVSFEFRDVGRLQGDHYFVRVTQSDDAMAWSSPVWVGGYPTR